MPAHEAYSTAGRSYAPWGLAGSMPSCVASHRSTRSPSLKHGDGSPHMEARARTAPTPSTGKISPSHLPAIQLHATVVSASTWGSPLECQELHGGRGTEPAGLNHAISLVMPFMCKIGQVHNSPGYILYIQEATHRYMEPGKPHGASQAPLYIYNYAGYIIIYYV